MRIREILRARVLWRHREGEAVKRQLEEARAELLAPLRAASMESYARAYPHLVRLCHHGMRLAVV